MTLDPKALEAAHKSFCKRVGVGLDVNIEDAITAYLAATKPNREAGDAGELVERLRREAAAFENDNGADPEADYGTAKLLRAAADFIEAQAASLAEAVRERDALSADLEKVQTELDAEHRAATDLRRRLETVEGALREIRGGLRMDGRVWLAQPDGTREEGPSLNVFIDSALSLSPDTEGQGHG